VMSVGIGNTWVLGSVVFWGAVSIAIAFADIKVLELPAQCQRCFGLQLR